jgi:UDP-2-acetamido-3-amino-2,3-dideoxy-glucuronate N-acetyltransferase
LIFAFSSTRLKSSFSVAACSIGRYALVGAGAVVTKDVPDYALLMGVPARLAGWVCECGERLRFENDNATCLACGKRYLQTGKAKVKKNE